MKSSEVIITLFLILLGSLLSSSLAIPDAATATKGFQPLPHARGVPQGKVLSTTKTKKAISDDNVGAGTFAEQTYGAPFGGGHGAGPTKTIYVNVPPEQYPIPKPIAAGPPRKHYRIVFIRSPSPPPPQPIIPPRVEQKTLIYVLHPRQQAQGHNIVEVPDVKHDPQVYFIQYDDEPPTAEDLQDLVKNTIDNHGAGGFNYGAPGLAVASSSSSGIFPAASAPSYQDNVHSGNEINIQTQKKLPQGLQQVLYNNALNSQLIRAKPEALDSSKISPFPQPQKEKLARTRQTTSESKTKIKSTQPTKTSPRIAEFLNKRQTPETPIHFKRFTRNPEDALKTEFRESFAKPFRFGAKTSKEAKKQEAPAVNQAKAQSS